MSIENGSKKFPISRRQLLYALAGLLATGGLYKSLSPNRIPEPEDTENRVGGEIEKNRKSVKELADSIRQPKIPTYEGWSPKIQLPDVEIPDQSFKLTPEEVEKSFIPESIDKAKLQAFYSRFDKAWVALRNKENDLSDDFVQGLIEGCRDWLRNPKSTSDDAQETADQIGRLLIPHGYWLDRRPKQNINRFTIARVDRVQMVKANFEGKELSIPLVRVKENLHWGNEHNNDQEDIQGRFVEEGNFLVVYPERTMAVIQQIFPVIEQRYRTQGTQGPKPSLATSTDTAVRMFIYHEVMHAVLSNLKGIDAKRDDAVKLNRDIPMGHYSLSNDSIIPQNHQLHELIANGYAMSKGKETSIYTVVSIIDSKRQSYAFARTALRTELLHHEKIDQNAFLTGLIKQKETDDLALLLDEILKLSDEDFRRIGERLAKLGLYLTQTDER